MRILTLPLTLAVASGANAGTTFIDFEQDLSGMNLVNGQQVESPDEFGSLVEISSTDNPSLGATIFDTDPMGPNVGGPDPDLLVGTGNALILQDPSSPMESSPGVFETPDDTTTPGSINLEFNEATEILSIDLIDIDEGNSMIVTLTDADGNERVFDVPNGWTGDVTEAGPGIDTLDLTDLGTQLGAGGTKASAMQDAGFDPNSVVNLNVFRTGSGAIDNIQLIPTPGSASLAAAAGGLVLSRRRR